MTPTAFHSTTPAKNRLIADAVLCATFPFGEDQLITNASALKEPTASDEGGKISHEPTYTFRMCQGAKLVSVTMKESDTVADEAGDASGASLAVLVAVTRTHSDVLCNFSPSC